MKLSKTQIEKISKKIVQTWRDSGEVELLLDEKQIAVQIENVISKEFAQEDDIHKDAVKMLEQFQEQINSGEIDGAKMLNMIKAQLKKERKIVE